MTELTGHDRCAAKHDSFVDRSYADREVKI